MPKFSSQEKKRINSLLMENGKKLFNEKGFYNVTAEDIALSAKIAKGTFYHFFKNKEHLYMVINNTLQKMIFEEVQKMIIEIQTLKQTEKLYQILCYIMEEFIKYPLIMEIDSNVWTRIEEKAPKECIEENKTRDLQLIQAVEKSGLNFRYDLETTTRILQMQFVQLTFLRKETSNIELIKIVFKALSEHLIKESYQ